MNAEKTVISPLIGSSVAGYPFPASLRDAGDHQNVETGSRSVTMRATSRAETRWAFEVEFRIDQRFMERLQQLRSLVPPPNALTLRRDLVIDKVRLRLPTARWRNDLHEDLPVEGSCLVVASDGTLSCAAKCPGTRDRLQTPALPIAELVELHQLASPGMALHIGADLAGR
ncbi:hypothetical protein [Variovorax gossypii]